MKTLVEIGETIIQVREAVNEMELHGFNNASLVMFCNQKCNELVAEINEALKTAPPGNIELNITEQPPEENQNGDPGPETTENRGS